jgi:hypothetical protein
MSVSSVPGANSVFFASLPIDPLPIDKVWEKVRGFAAPVKAKEQRPPFDPAAGFQKDFKRIHLTN